MRALLHHRPLFLVFRTAYAVFLAWKFRIKVQPAGRIQGPCLVLANHTMNYDPMVLGMSFPMLLHFLASDHIFRKGLISRLLVALVDPIPRLKATTEIASTKRILNKLRAGDSVCIFPEGNRTWSGETVEIPESVGKLAKKAGVNLVLYVMHGGYFSQPRWGSHLRRGRITGGIAEILTPDDLAGMNVEEINERIRKVLYVNAYEDQRREPIAFKGKNIAEDLEVALYLCPDCQGIGTLESRGDTLSCSCGLALRYTPYGNFESLDGGEPPYREILPWFAWQQGRMQEIAAAYLESADPLPLFRDPEEEFHLVERAKGDSLAGKGALEAHRHGLVLKTAEGEEKVYRWEDISDMSIHGPKVLVFSTLQGETFEVKSPLRRSAVKYLDTYHGFRRRAALSGKGLSHRSEGDA
jgi:1-acyl-sn-glycerol-3-phosphate acyltransferase